MIYIAEYIVDIYCIKNRIKFLKNQIRLLFYFEA